MTRPAAISDVERARRAEAIRQATASVALEGFVRDETMLALDQRYIDGELDWEAYREATFKIVREEAQRLYAARQHVG
ncbi:hypothetical protein AA0472_2372 [Acetobacter estunensis NRIC 0472]|nr:hypothetical protein AA0472_2372 [Acetobacter estunensis NRIC 0472]